MADARARLAADIPIGFIGDAIKKLCEAGDMNVLYLMEVCKEWEQLVCEGMRTVKLVPRLSHMSCQSCTHPSSPYPSLCGAPDMPFPCTTAAAGEGGKYHGISKSRHWEWICETASIFEPTTQLVPLAPLLAKLIAEIVRSDESSYFDDFHCAIRAPAGVPSMARFTSLTTCWLEYRDASSDGWASDFRVLGQGCRKLEDLRLKEVSPLLLLEDAESLFEHCSHLRTLEFDKSYGDHSLPPFTPLTTLARLAISRNNSIVELPDFDPLAALESLELLYLEILIELPPLTALTRLKNLSLCGTSLLTDPISLAHLSSSLLSLNVVDSVNVDVAGLSALQALAISCHCHPPVINHCVENLSQASRIASMELFDVYSPEHDLVSEMPLGGLRQMTSLRLRLDDSFTILASLTSLTRLEALVGRIQDWQVEGFPNLPELKLLTLGPLGSILNEMLTWPPHHHTPTALEVLELCHCKVSLGVTLQQLPLLVQLNLDCCEVQWGRSEVVDQDEEASASAAPQFVRFNLCILRKDAVTHMFGALRSVTWMHISCCQFPKRGPLNLESLVNLEELAIVKCPTLKSFPSLSALSALQSLDLSYCSCLRTIAPDLPPSLAHLTLRKCQALKALPSLQHLSRLECLLLSHCSLLRELPPLGSLTSLRCLDLEGCQMLRSLPPLHGLLSLQRLSLVDCIVLTDTVSLTEAENLMLVDKRRSYVELELPAHFVEVRT